MRPADSERARLLARLEAVIDDPRVRTAMMDTPRELFVPRALRNHAWDDRPLPIGDGQTISQPLLVARMCELLTLDGTESVLDVGTGSGYHAAVLSRLAAHVYSIERHRTLSEQAERNLAAAEVGNVTLLVGDGTWGHAGAAPYDAINVAAASTSAIPDALQRQLGPNGRLVAPVDGDDQRLVLTQREGECLRQTTL